MRILYLFILLISIPSNIFPQEKQEKQEKKIPVVIDGDEMNFLQAENKVIAKGNVQMQYQDMNIFCDEADYNANTHIAYLKGKVKIVKPGETIYGEDVVYDFNKQHAEMVKARMESPPMYGEAKEAIKVDQTKYLFKKGYITTCDLIPPHYSMTAKTITVYPGEKMVAKHVMIKIGGLPIFYLPYLSQSLKERKITVQLNPGKNSEWGPYVLGKWRYRLNDANRGYVHLDWYERRSWGKGITHKIENTKFGEGLMNIYFIQDKLYEVDKRNSFFGDFPEREAIAEKYLEDDRYKWQIFYTWKPIENLSINSEFGKFSDSLFMKDFFEREYEKQQQMPAQTIIDYVFPNSSLSFLTNKRVNRFYSQTEYLPQLEHNLFQQKIGESDFYIESKTTLGNLTTKTANSDVDSDAVRLHSHNIFSYSTNYKWLYVNPYAGAFSAFYSKNVFGDENIWRNSPETGMTLSTKIYKTLNANYNIFGENITKMRHIITPSVSYKYIAPPTVMTSHILQFDGVDSLARIENAIFTLGNKLQVKNNSGNEVWDFIYFSPALEYTIDQEAKGSFFNNIKADLELYPKRGISLGAHSTYTVPTRRITDFNMDFTLKDEEKNAFSLGHRYSRVDSSQGTLEWIYNLTSKLQFKNYLRYEYNRRDLLEQRYDLRVDLHCWFVDLDLTVDNQRDGLKDFAFQLVFTLKAFPDKVHFDYGHDYKGMYDRI